MTVIKYCPKCGNKMDMLTANWYCSVCYYTEGFEEIDDDDWDDTPGDWDIDY